MIDAENEQARQIVEEKSKTATVEAEQGRQLRGRKPKDPSARLKRARIDLKIAHDRVLDLDAAEAEKVINATARGQKPQGRPFAYEITRARVTLERSQAALAQAQQTLEDMPAPASQANMTDPDSRIMKTQKGWVQGYNTQAIVTENQIVLAAHVSQDPFDVRLYQPMIDKLSDTLAQAQIIDTPELILADAG